MRVLYIAPEYPNRGMNAAQVRANQVLRRLARAVDLRVLAFPPEGAAKEAFGNDRVTPVRRRQMNPLQIVLGTVSAAPRAFRRFDTPEVRRTFRAMLASFQPDVVHFDSLATLGLADVALSARTRPKIVAQTHDAVSRIYESFLRDSSGPSYLNTYWEWRKIRRFEARRLECAEAILVDSPEDAEFLRGVNRQNSVEVLPLGFDEDTFGISGSGILLEQPSIVFSGSLAGPQSTDAARFLVGEIMERVWRTNPDVHVYLAGANPTKAVRSLESERVHVTGFVDELAAYLRSATLYVCPLRLGSGMRTRVVEALACGATVIATHETVRGLMIPEGEPPPWIASDDPDDLARAIRDHLEVDRDPLKRRAAEYARAHYSWDGVVGRIVDLYGRLAGQGRQAARSEAQAR